MILAKNWAAKIATCSLKGRYVTIAREIQADALRHAAELCMGQRSKLRMESGNTACEDCAIVILADVNRLNDPASALEKETNEKR